MKHADFKQSLHHSLNGFSKRMLPKVFFTRFIFLLLYHASAEYIILYSYCTYALVRRSGSRVAI